MRVEYHLLRRMLETIEAAPTPEIGSMPELTGDGSAQGYHLQLLIDGGYVTAQQSHRYGPACRLALTLAGQELLDKLRRGRTHRAERWVERLVTVGAARLLFGAE